MLYKSLKLKFKYLIYCIFLTLLSISGNNYAMNVYGSINLHNKNLNESLTVYGAVNASKLQVINVNAYGASEIKESQIYGNFIGKGATQLQGVEISKNLEVDGALTFNQGLAKEIYIRGSANLQGVHVTGVIDIKGDLILENCDTMDIIVTSFKDKVKVNLTGKNYINGKIIFPNNNGEVFLSKETTIEHGIKGGEIVYPKVLKSTPRVINGKTIRKSKFD